MKVVGSGAAAALVAACFDQVDFAVVSDEKDFKQSPPLVVLNEGTLSLIKDLIGTAELTHMQTAGQMLTERVVIWGEYTERVHAPSLLIPPVDIVTEIRKHKPAGTCALEPTINVRGRGFNTGEAAGPRFAFAWPSVPGILPISSAFYIVAVEQCGWAFIAPTDKGHVIVQTVIADEDSAAALYVGSQALARIGIDSDLSGYCMIGSIDAAPRFGTPFTKDEPCAGDELIALDPICGDGIGHALRAGVLLAALYQQVDCDHEWREAIYTNRIRRSFVAHLRACEAHYSMFASAPQWNDLIWTMRRTRLLHEALLYAAPDVSYRLERTSLRAC